MRVLAAPRSLTLRRGSKPGTRHRWWLGGREIQENVELLVQMVQQSSYVTRPGFGRYVCTEVDWLPVRATFQDIEDAPEVSKGAAKADGRLLCLKLPFRCGGTVLVPAQTSMQFAWPGPTATRAA